jgi:hypothetical protein
MERLLLLLALIILIPRLLRLIKWLLIAGVRVLVFLFVLTLILKLFE